MITKLTLQVPGVVYQYRLFRDGQSAFPFASPGIRSIYDVIGETLGGGRALRSTANDMQRFVEAALGAGDPAVMAAWGRVLVPQRPFPQKTDGQMGLLIARQTVDGRFEYEKGGQTAGFTSFIVSPPRRRPRWWCWPTPASSPTAG
jgi:CubicO group peptidase (beta-lactamase class C family)